MGLLCFRLFEDDETCLLVDCRLLCEHRRFEVSIVCRERRTFLRALLEPSLDSWTRLMDRSFYCGRLSLPVVKLEVDAPIRLDEALGRLLVQIVQDRELVGSKVDDLEVVDDALLGDRFGEDDDSASN
jgi:hypothetical protein